MRLLTLWCGCLLSVLAAYLGLVVQLVFCLWLINVNLGVWDPAKLLVYLGVPLGQLVFTPYFMGVLSGCCWCKLDMTENQQEDWSTLALLLWLLPIILGTFGLGILLLPVFIWPYSKGLNVGLKMSRSWREFLALDVPESPPSRRQNRSSE